MRKKLIILHGWGQSALDWKPVVDMTNNFIETECFDLPGFGKEPVPDSSWGVQEYAQWVMKKITRPSILLGHSFGGRVALALTNMIPQLINKIILFGAPCLYRPSKIVRLKKLWVKFAKILNLPYRNMASLDYQKASESNLGKIFSRVVITDQAESLSQLITPALLLRGENDTAVSAKTYKEMYDLIPVSKKKLITIPHSSHNSHIDSPYLFLGLLKKYIDGS